MKTIHFISGLPRSGSTLLASILKQNPKFQAGMTSPVSGMFRSIEDITAKRNETSVFITDKQREQFLKGIFDIYYKNHKNKVIFDTSRMWCARTGILFKLFPKAKMICCVREVAWILDSFERLYKKNNQQPSAIYGYDTGGTIYTRTLRLAASSGVVGYSLDALREAVASEEVNRILLVDYENLCKKPSITLEKIYTFLELDKFAHNFNDVEHNFGEFDRHLGVPGLHDVREKVEWTPRKSILPPDLFARFRNDNFWRTLNG